MVSLQALQQAPEPGVEGTLHSERQLAEMHEELRWLEEHGRSVFASQLTPQDPEKATWQIQAIRWTGGELAAGAERLPALAAERGC